MAEHTFLYHGEPYTILYDSPVVDDYIERGATFRLQRAQRGERLVMVHEPYGSDWVLARRILGIEKNRKVRAVCLNGDLLDLRDENLAALAAGEVMEQKRQVEQRSTGDGRRRWMNAGERKLAAHWRKLIEDEIGTNVLAEWMARHDSASGGNEA